MIGLVVLALILAIGVLLLLNGRRAKRRAEQQRPTTFTYHINAVDNASEAFDQVARRAAEQVERGQR